MNGNSFRSVENLEFIDVEEGSTTFKQVEGLLVTTGNSLVYFPPKSPLVQNKIAVIPNEITGINPYAFAGCLCESIQFPDNMQGLYNYAFAYNDN